MAEDSRGRGRGAAAARPRRQGRPVEAAVRHAPAEGNPAHSLIEGNTSLENCRRMACATRVVIEPTAGR